MSSSVSSGADKSWSAHQIWMEERAATGLRMMLWAWQAENTLLRRGVGYIPASRGKVSWSLAVSTDRHSCKAGTGGGFEFACRAWSAVAREGEPQAADINQCGGQRTELQSL